MAKVITRDLIMILLWAILFLVIAIALGILAFGGIAIAVSFFTKVLFLLSFICFLIALILIVIEKIQAKKRQL
jgi:uncharacterized membrane protein YtjA (UPF0391 family)